ncbi:hypothetical protein E2C01_061927 [Portunus trituberculatus]|uniref:Uncharacterized protein n=1 Tax=Portunus trituberculatus TaxID=210409 RepID=A0A5B7HGN4_PORTR|nr:hypothetical protein [Portunus trituberculatus]
MNMKMCHGTEGVKMTPCCGLWCEFGFSSPLVQKFHVF